MKFENYMSLEFPSKSCNEAFARAAVACFAAQLDPTVEEIGDIRTAVSEAVTNAIVHGYENEMGIITIIVHIKGKEVTIQIKDKGRGIEDISKARQTLYTTKPDMERSGMGFTIMESFMDSLELKSNERNGLVVKMTKTFKNSNKVAVGE